MFQSSKFFAPVMALAAMVVFSVAFVRADDAPATRPTGTGSLVISVVDADNKPVTTASVGVYPGKPPKAPKKPKKPAVDAGAPAPAPQADEPATPEKPEKPAKPNAATPLFEGTVDATTGQITFSNVPAGDYHIVTKAKGFGRGTADAVVTDSAVSVTVTMKAKKAVAN